MSKANEVITLLISEGGVVPIPNALMKKIMTPIKTGLVGYLFTEGNSFISLLDTYIDSDIVTPKNKKELSQMRDDLKDFMKRVNKQVKLGDAKLGRTIGRKSKINIDIKPEDVKPYVLQPPFEKGFKLPLKVSRNDQQSPDSKKGLLGSVRYRLKGGVPQKDTFEFQVDVSRMADSINKVKRLFNNVAVLLKTDLDSRSLSVMKKAVPSLRGAYEHNLNQVLSNTKHEMTHLLQAMASVGIKGEFFTKKRALTGLSKEDKRQIYLASDVEYKAWLVTEVDKFFSNMKVTKGDVGRAILDDPQYAKVPKKDLSKAAWDSAFELAMGSEFAVAIKTVNGEKAFQRFAKDFSVAIQKDTRNRGLK